MKFVKDLQQNVVVTEKFECSRFDVHFHKSLGWVSTNLSGRMGRNSDKFQNLSVFSQVVCKYVTLRVK